MRKHRPPNLVETNGLLVYQDHRTITSIIGNPHECSPGSQFEPACRFASLGAEPNINRGWSGLRFSSKLSSPRRCALTVTMLIAMSAVNFVSRTIIKIEVIG